MYNKQPNSKYAHQSIPCFIEGDLAENLFEQRYSEVDEPWNYSERAVELYRHERVAEEVLKLVKSQPTKPMILEVGAGLGLMTERLAALPIEPAIELWSMDISLAALTKNKKRLMDKGLKLPQYLCASVMDSPFEVESFDGIVLSDVLKGSDFTDDETLLSYKELRRILKPNGWIFITEYLSPRDFKSYLQLVSEAGVKAVDVSYLGDRISFQLINNLKKSQNRRLKSFLLGNRTLNKVLCQLSSKLGPKMSKHIFIHAARK